MTNEDLERAREWLSERPITAFNKYKLISEYRAEGEQKVRQELLTHIKEMYDYTISSLPPELRERTRELLKKWQAFPE
jgi:hypothetical protein